MSGRAEGRRAFVTGAAGGLGFGIAKLFHEEGAAVAVADIRGADGARQSLGGNAISVTVDVRDRESVDAAISEAWDAFHGIDVLVEKPFVETLDVARELVALAATQRKVLMVSQNYRFFPAARKVAQLVSESKLGKLHEVSIDFRRYSPGSATGPAQPFLAL